MSLQARAGEWDHRLYNVDRDVAHNFGDVCTETARRLEEGLWPELAAYLRAVGASEDELGESCRAFLQCVATSTDIQKESLHAALVRTGWFEVEAPAQIAFMATLGTVMLGYFWAGVREATLGGVGPTLEYRDLALAGRRAAATLALPRWRRRLYAWGRAVRLRLLRLAGVDVEARPLQSAHARRLAELQAAQRREAP